MNILTKTIVSLCGLLVVVGCDTVEDVFSVGDRPNDNEILSLDQSQLSFRPEGGSYEVHVKSIARWEITMANKGAGQFSVSPSSGKGNGTVTVTCKPNSTQNSYNDELYITPSNFEMEPVKVNLRQSNATFSIERIPSSESVPEEGGSVTMTAYSSLDWELAIIPHDADKNVGEITWLSITPGLSGEGNDGNIPIEYRFTWTPNYTDKLRTIRLQLKPSTEMELSDLPQPFTLTQLAGTLPQDVKCLVDNLGVVDVDLTLEYHSRSPIKDCAVRVYKVDDGNAVLLNTVKPEAEGFSLNGGYKLSIKDLAENSKFRIEPMVENQVGAKVGEPCEISTGIKPENITYQGVSIENASNGGVVVTADETYAEISFTVISDVEPLGENRISSVAMTVNGNTINLSPQSSEAGKWKYSYTAESLDPNHEYEYQIEVKGYSLPKEQGKVDNNDTSYTGKFKTKGKTPGDKDNNKPILGE